MKICPRCGKVNLDSDNFCTGCGQPLGPVPSQPETPNPSPAPSQVTPQVTPVPQSAAPQQPYYQPAPQQPNFQPVWNEPAPPEEPEKPEKPKKKVGLIIAIVVGFILIALLTAILIILLKDKNTSTASKDPDEIEESVDEEESRKDHDAVPDENSGEVDESSILSEADGEGSQAEADTSQDTTEASSETTEAAESSGQGENSQQETTTKLPVVAYFPRPSLMAGAMQLNNQSLVPSVPTYTVEPDFSNIANNEIIYLNDEVKAIIAQNGFVVTSSGNREFFEVYESNRYSYMANFITVDSMMHTYHLYFAYLQKNTEKNYLAINLQMLSERMLEKANQQLEALRGTEWEDAARRNVAFFTIGAVLQNENVTIPGEVTELVSIELSRINEHVGIDVSTLTGEYEDYSQYKPRGYYEGDPQLEAYFRAMMWYGRLNFTQKVENLNRSALLITLALDADTLPIWESIYSITSFFAGASDDSGYYEYKPIINAAYGEGTNIQALPGNADGWALFNELTAELDPPRINSVPMDDDGGATDKMAENKGFRFMGQRFTLDEAIFQNLTYSKVKEKSETDKRMLPDTLDAAAAMGSEQALKILEAQGATSYPGYLDNMAALREEVQSSTDEQWNASLYSSWLYTLKPLLDQKGEGYPQFMRTDLWAEKDLETFAGSFTELKHDTVLYAKQMMAEMGGGPIPEVDDRGYVEPEPEVFSRLAVLSEKTATGLKEFHMLSENDEANLMLLSSLAKQLMVISEKELVNETLTDEEYELIRSFGGNLEHFWLETIKDEAAKYDDVNLNRTEQFPAALVVDIATDPNGVCLEVATGNPNTIYVACMVDGQVKICSGSVFNWYQFEQPISERMTDAEWRQLIGIQLREDGTYNWEKIGVPAKPAWTLDYRYDYGSGF